MLVTAGATEALAGALLGLLDTGDEVVLFEPMYDSYQACIALAGAVAKPVTLRPPDYAVDLDALRAAITPKTKLLLINSPHNPTGMVLGRDELAAIAALAVERDLIVVCDEVYEHLTFDDVRARPAVHDAGDGASGRCRSPVAARRSTPRAGRSAGCAVPSRWSPRRARPSSSSPTSTGRRSNRPSPPGCDCRTSTSTASAPTCEAKRDRLVPGLVDAGFTVYPTHGTYFVTVDIRPLRADGDGLAFCRELPERCGIVAIPNEVFYANRHEGRHLVRFAFCKRFEVLDEAVARLKSLA